MSKDRRERTIHWDDPPATAREALAMAGRDGRGKLYAAGVETCLVFDRPAEPQ